jgi:mono/diheme cytochrome c family protein
MTGTAASRVYRIAAFLTTSWAAAFAADAPDPAAIEFFEKQVRPVLTAQCFSCHGPQQQFSSLRVDSREALLKGGNRGPALIPGDPKLSLLARAVRHDGLKMPAGGKLPDEQVAAIEKWISLGAPWPENDRNAAAGPKAPGFYERIRKEHWAFQPVRDTKPEEIAGIEHPVDRFLVSPMRKEGLQPAGQADRRTLIRRLSFVLTGLPPTPLEVDLFVRDTSPGAYEHLVDRLLASPHFGEQWARHWMDVMRFAETFGNDWNYEIKGSWLYRDYLIRAFNGDVPYDQLIREHLAGDLLPKPRVNAKEGINESIIGTSFLRMGELGHDDCIRFRQIRTDVVDNQIDTLGKAFQGLTIACARCHDHKLDPIPTSDYYGLYGVLTSSRMVMRNAGLASSADSAKQRLRQLKPQIREELAKSWTEDARLIPRYLLAANRAWKGLPPEQNDLTELSVDRMQAWVTLLERQKTEMEDPLFPWVSSERVSSEKEKAENWTTLKAKIEAEAQARAAFNREHFQPFGLVAQDGYGGWHADGNALNDGASPSGEFAVTSEGPKAITGIFPAGVYTNALSERLNGALRSPLVPKDKKFVSLLVMGGKLGAWRTILDNCMLSEDYQTLEHDSLAWLKIPNRTDQPTLPFYLELVTKADNPRIPDRPGRLKATEQQIASPYSYFGIAKAVVHDVDESPRAELSHISRLFAGSIPETTDARASRYQEAISEAIRRWSAGQASDDDAKWLQWVLDNHLLSNAAELSPRLSALIGEYRIAESRIDAPKTFEGLADLDPGYDFPVLPAGDATNPGKIVPRGFLELIIGKSDGLKVAGSGRLETAELIAGPANPLTARVMANRIWLYVFGRGIVPTADNFGTYGEPPSNPELLDFLATRFVREGWSTKKQIRFLVLSQAFQESSRPTPDAQRIDPLNRLLSHYPVRRLEGESIRDAILEVSGRLDPTLYGPPVQPHREEPKDYRKLYQGPLDGDGRRSIYLKVTRHEGSRFLETFDFPNPTVARGNRDTTNVPPQALALLNDPFVVGQAGAWADRLIGQKAPTAEARIDSMFRSALGRLPDDAERARFVSLASETASLRHVEPGKLLDSRDVWKDVAHAIFNLKEFVYVR